MSIQTNPASIVFGAKEQWAPGIDFTNALANYTAGTASTNPVVTLTDAQTGAVITLTGSPTVTGNVVAQTIDKNLVTAGHTYNMICVVTPSGTTDLIEAVLVVSVPSVS